MAELRHSSAYRSETWRLDPSEFDGAAPAEVRIQIEPLADRPEELHLVVQADYPSDSEHRARQSREVIIHLK